MPANDILGELITALPSIRDHHTPGTPFYTFLQDVVRQQASQRFASPEGTPETLPPFGAVSFPFRSMGSISTLNLFEIDELIILSFYWANRQRYHRVLDIGANVGLHSLMLSRCGFDVRCYEPDPQHFAWLQDTLARNGCTNVTPLNAAVSSQQGTLEFVRVLGNTTGSHLAGSKDNPYGQLERFPVKVENIRDIITWADLLKVDAEGHEKEILCATHQDDWKTTDAMVEIGSLSNAEAVFGHFNKLGVALYSQKTNWQRVKHLADMPVSHHEGSLFITNKPEMFWG